MGRAKRQLRSMVAAGGLPPAEPAEDALVPTPLELAVRTDKRDEAARLEHGRKKSIMAALD